MYFNPLALLIQVFQDAFIFTYTGYPAINVQHHIQAFSKPKKLYLQTLSFSFHFFFLSRSMNILKRIHSS